MDSKRIDQQTKEVLIALGEMLGKDTQQIEETKTRAEVDAEILETGFNENAIIIKENEFVKNEITKYKKENDKIKR